MAFGNVISSVKRVDRGATKLLFASTIAPLSRQWTMQVRHRTLQSLISRYSHRNSNVIGVHTSFRLARLSLSRLVFLRSVLALALDGDSGKTSRPIPHVSLLGS